MNLQKLFEMQAKHWRVRIMSDKELMQEALKWQEHIKVLANDHAEDELYQKRSKVFDWLVEQAEKTEKYREALEFYANEKSWMNREVTILMDGEPTDVEDCPAIFDDGGNIARQALEGEG